MAVDYYKPNQVLISFTAAVPNVVFLLEQINRAPGVWYTVLAWQTLFFLYLFFKNHQKQLAFTWQDQQDTFPMLPAGYKNL